MNFAEFIPVPPKNLSYNVVCFNDMRHFNFSVNDGIKSQEVVSKFIFNHIYPNYIEHYYIKHDNNITTMHYIVIVNKIGINIYVSILKFFKYYNINLSILSKCHVLILFYFFLIFGIYVYKLGDLLLLKEKIIYLPPLKS